MSGIGFEVLVILLMIAANGIFAMSEIAVVTSRRSRLQLRAEQGDAGARRALELTEHPNRFLSTVQIGITLVGILAGAYGGATIATQLDEALEGIPALVPYSEEISLAVVVLAITYLSLVVGELVPKRIALTNPEGIASRVARPMDVVSKVAAPLVRILSFSTELILRVLGVRKGTEPPVTEAEITAMIEQGTKAGIFQEEEQELVERIFWLADQQVGAMMTPRRQIVYFELDEPPETLRSKLVEHRYSRFPVCEGKIDNVVGMVQAKDLLARLLAGEAVDLRAALRQPLFVPEGLRPLRLLELFRESGVHLAVVIDEYGGVEGIVTLNDILEEVAGQLHTTSDPAVVRRDDGSWLVDASLSMEDLWEALALEERREEERAQYHTVGGFVFSQLGHVPAAGETFTSGDLRVEVLDMDGNRVDKVLISTAAPALEPPRAAGGTGEEEG